MRCEHAGSPLIPVNFSILRERSSHMRCVCANLSSHRVCARSAGREKEKQPRLARDLDERHALQPRRWNRCLRSFRTLASFPSACPTLDASVSPLLSRGLASGTPLSWQHGSSLSQAGVASSGGRLLEPRTAATRAAFDALELRGSELSGLERRATRGLDVQPESSASSGGDPAWWMAA